MEDTHSTQQKSRTLCIGYHHGGYLHENERWSKTSLYEENVPRKRFVGGPKRAAFLSHEGVILTEGEIMSSETRTGGGVEDGEKEM